MALSKKKRISNERWMSANYHQVAIRWPNEFYERLHAAVEKSGESLAGYVRKAIEARMLEDEKAGGEG